jgi:hypothetical protein
MILVKKSLKSGRVEIKIAKDTTNTVTPLSLPATLWKMAPLDAMASSLPSSCVHSGYVLP